MSLSTQAALFFYHSETLHWLFDFFFFLYWTNDMFCPLTLVLCSLHLKTLLSIFIKLFHCKAELPTTSTPTELMQVHTSRSTVIVSQHIYRQNSHRLEEWETAWNHQDVMINDLMPSVSEASHISTSRMDIRAARMWAKTWEM